MRPRSRRSSLIRVAFIEADYILLIVDLSILAALISANVINDPEPHAVGRTRAGIAIQRRISQRKFTQITFARELGKSQPWISQSLLSDTERTLRRLALDEPETFTLMLKLLDWDYATLRSETGALSDVLLPGEVPGEVTLTDSDVGASSRHTDVYDMLSAGPGNDGGTVVGTIDIPETWRGEHAAYLVSGDSMSPRIPDGSTVVIKCQDYASPGNIIVAWVPEHGMVVKELKQSNREGFWLLTSFNPDYPPIWAEELRIYGIVRQVRTDFEMINGNHGTN